MIEFGEVFLFSSVTVLCWLFLFEWFQHLLYTISLTFWLLPDFKGSFSCFLIFVIFIICIHVFFVHKLNILRLMFFVPCCYYLLLLLFLVESIVTFLQLHKFDPFYNFLFLLVLIYTYYNDWNLSNSCANYWIIDSIEMYWDGSYAISLEMLFCWCYWFMLKLLSMYYSQQKR